MEYRTDFKLALLFSAQSVQIYMTTPRKCWDLDAAHLVPGEDSLLTFALCAHMTMRKKALVSSSFCRGANSIMEVLSS